MFLYLILGIGMGLSNCRHDLDAPFLLHGKKIPTNNSTGGYQIVVSPPATTKKNEQK